MATARQVARSLRIESKNTDPRTSYRNALDLGLLQPDQRQFEIVGKLQDLYERIISTENSQTQKPDKQGFFSSLFGGGKTAVQPVNKIPGLYLWGGVGRGKTLLCDMFFDGLPIQNKKRIHFHRFMRSVHLQLANIKQAQSPLEIVAEKFAAEFRVLVLDEMHINDITDAMLMSGLLHGLFSRGVIIITTSNVTPDDLYRDGLQRSQFLPAIKALKDNTEVVFLGGDIDYRLRALENAEIYHTPLDEYANATLEAYFQEVVAASAYTEKSPLEINDRLIDTILLADNVVWFSFDSLCNTNRSTDDYIEIARLFHTVLLSDVRSMDGKNSDVSRRFINMVDEFYDRNVKLVVTAEASPEKLYQGDRLAFEFDRTVSRLREMQSSEYLSSQHQP